MTEQNLTTDNEIAAALLPFVSSEPAKGPNKEPTARKNEEARDEQEQNLSEATNATEETGQTEPTDEESDVEHDSNDDAEDDGLDTIQLPGNKSFRVPKEVADFLHGRQADYTQKTQALSKERQEFAAEKQAVQSERAAYKQNLEQLASIIGQAKKQEPNWEQLIADARVTGDWSTFNEQRYLHDELQKHEAKLVQEYQQVLAQQQQENYAMAKQHAEEGLLKLKGLNKDWSDEAKFVQDMSDTFRFLNNTYGVTENDMKSITDPRILHMAYNAMLNSRTAQKAASITSKAVKSKSLPAGSAGKFSNKKSSVAKGIDSLRQQGARQSPEAQAALMHNILSKL